MVIFFCAKFAGIYQIIIKNDSLQPLQWSKVATLRANKATVVARWQKPQRENVVATHISNYAADISAESRCKGTIIL
jgi:hypothetical protein